MDWRHVGPDPAQGPGGWLSPAPAGADSARGAPSTALPEYVVRSSEMARVGRIITPGWTTSGSRPDSEQTGTAFSVAESSRKWYFVSAARIWSDSCRSLLRCHVLESATCQYATCHITIGGKAELHIRPSMGAFLIFPTACEGTQYLSRATEDCRGQPSKDTLKTSAEKFQEGKKICFVNMSYLSDSENLSESVDVTGSSALTSSTSSSSAGESTGPRGRTPVHLSGISDIPSPSDPVSPTSREQAQPAPVVDLTAEGGDVSERTASQASMSGQEDTPGSESTGLSGEQIQAHQQPHSRAMCINDIKVYRRADMEMVDLADDRLVYTADYYTSAITRRYLDALRQEFRIPDDVDLVVPGADDLPSRPPPGYVALSAEYFQARLCLPLHPFLRRALIRLNVAPAQLNANAYRVLGTFITGCPDSDKQFKHLWFYAGGRWLHGHLVYNEVPPSERVPVTFRRGYVWTRAPHVLGLSMAKIDALRELSDPERSQHRMLTEASLKEYHWVSSSSTSDRPDDQPRTSQSRVTVARMPEPAVHYHSRTSHPEVATTDDLSGVPRGASAATVRGLPSDDPSPGT
ncbi:hypothetical protein TIFTF001_032114 [Ficus carica]|uniref:Uncharacterized protein n=1 Tax=Ficus carica TaxID=3494 RepID=A0AA88DWC1_FICCA|nr:hypothetical protein TIFTF001_032114 [Ficus carica]